MVIAPTIETKGLTLVPLKLKDIHTIYEISKEKQSIEDFQYVADSVDNVKAWLEPSYHDPANLIWVIRKQRKTIGLFDVCFEAEYSDWDHNVCRIGYFLDFREHNQGYTTEALIAVIDWLFRHADIERIEAEVTLTNVPSYRVLEKAGFIREKIVEGSWQWYDQVYDSADYYLLRTSSIRIAQSFSSRRMLAPVKLRSVTRSTEELEPPLNQNFYRFGP